MKRGTDYSDSIIFVLVEPQYRGNIGAAARVINNFGFSKIRLIGTVPRKEDHYLAVHSQEIMENIELFDDLKTAIDDADIAVAMTRRCGRKKKTDFDIRQLPGFLKQLPRKKTALVFGRETFGLKDEEVELCPVRCQIPTNPAFPSLNLAQAVAIVAYELQQDSNNGRTENYLASQKTVDNYVRQIINSISRIGYFENGDPERTHKQLLSTFIKSYTTEENLQFFKNMFHRLEILSSGKNKTESEDKKRP